MLSARLAVIICFACLAGLLVLAFVGESVRHRDISAFRRKSIYVLSSCIFCTSWSFCGSAGMASRTGFDALSMSLGPALAFGLFHPVLARMILLAKTQRITSVADFIAVRYGKAGSVAATVTIIALLATIPFLALQIRAISESIAIFLDGRIPVSGQSAGAAGPTAIVVTIVLAAFTVAVGTRRLDATEHQNGLMIAIAVESVVRLLAYMSVGIFVSWSMFKGIGDLTDAVTKHPTVAALVHRRLDLWSIASSTLASMIGVLFLPRQFHVSVVENRDVRDARTAGWFVPAYVAAMSLFVMPITVAGLILFKDGSIDRDYTILALPVLAQNPFVSAVALIGSVSAGMSMILVSTTALAVMASNDLIIPVLLGSHAPISTSGGGMSKPPILALRRGAIILILALALIVAEIFGRTDLSAIALVYFAGIAQIAPAAIIGLFWRRGTARGAICGSVAGLLVVAYTLLLPSIAPSSAIVTKGPLSVGLLRPTALFGVDLGPFAHCVIWSLTINVTVFFALSLSRRANAKERLQANMFVSAAAISLATSFRLRQTMVSVDDLLAEVSRYMEPLAARRFFVEWHAARDLAFDGSRDADGLLVKYAEHLIASSIGAASSRIVLSILLKKRDMSEATARQMIDDIAFEIQSSRHLLQHAIDVARDGMAVFDADLRLVAWNRAYRDMFQFPSDLMRIGTPLDILVRSNAERGIYGQGPIDDFVGARLEALTRPTEGQRFYSAHMGRILEMRSVRLHNGALFFTYTDATAQVTSEEELEAQNLTLERRVRERTEQLEQLNIELLRAKAEAEDANISKSRFLAAASHDLLQPLSAARIYVASLHEKLRLPAQGEAARTLAANVDASLEAVEDILGALLEISHLDAGATKTDIRSFGIGDILRQLQTEFAPLARERGLRLRFVSSTLRVTSDRRLLRRMLQNLISNAIKYTMHGGVVVGVRRRGEMVRFDVYDTGIGIPESKQLIVFREFERLPSAVKASAGVGLGLSIVERLSQVLKHDISLHSVVGKGTRFSVQVPRAAALPADETAQAAAISIRHRSLEGLVVAAIDNELHVLSAITMLLRNWDCVVASGTDLSDVEAACDDLNVVPDVILADYHLGDADGLEAIAALRRRYGPRPAVLVTADRSAILREMAALADVRVLHKPVKPAALRALLSRWRLVKSAAE